MSVEPKIDIFSLVSVNETGNWELWHSGNVSSSIATSSFRPEGCGFKSRYAQRLTTRIYSAKASHRGPPKPRSCEFGREEDIN